MWTLALVVGSAALIEIAAVAAEPAIHSLHSAGPAVDSISVLEFGITEVDQLSIAAGRYLWVSGPRQGIAVIDLLTGSGARIGRAGAGPGEYRMVSRVFGCDDTGGWVDDQLQRVTWMAPSGKGEPRSIQLPSGLLSRAKTQSAWCEGDSLWIAVERQGAPASGMRVDSLAVFRVVRSTLDVDTIAKFQGSKRRLRSKGALRTSLRLPYESPPLLVRTSGQMIVIGRSIDSVWTLVSRPRRSAPIVGDGPSRALASRHLPVVRDSISKWYEAEMESQRYEPDLRREFRTLITELLADLDARNVSSR
jgi:hypothetical protein